MGNNKKIHTIVNLILTLNDQGNNLALDIRKGCVDIFDVHNECKHLPIGIDGYIYTTGELFLDADKHFDQTIKYLKNMLKK